MRTKLMLPIVLLILTISGCSVKTCKTPDIPRPDFNNTESGNIVINAKRCIKNFAILKNYTLKLEAANEVCK